MELKLLGIAEYNKGGLVSIEPLWNWNVYHRKR